MDVRVRAVHFILMVLDNVVFTRQVAVVAFPQTCWVCWQMTTTEFELAHSMLDRRVGREQEGRTPSWPLRSESCARTCSTMYAFAGSAVFLRAMLLLRVAENEERLYRRSESV